MEIPVTALTAPGLEPLSATLKRETAAAHTEAETSRFMAQLASGALNRAAVVNLTAQYWHIYRALEAAVMRAADNPGVAAITDPRLVRLPALEQDLRAMAGADWQNFLLPTPATYEYARRLDALTPADWPEIIAHHYVRYLGDISGGQVLARAFSSHYGMTLEELHFYDFSAIGKIPPYRNAYRAKLDALPTGGGQRERLIAAAQHAFQLNQNVFESLALATLR